MGGVLTYGWLEKKVWMPLVLILLSCTLLGQGDLPDIPDIIRVTVDHSDGGFLIQWEPSTDPDITSYRIYIRNNLVFEFVDAVAPDVFEYKYTGTSIRNPAFAVTAMDGGGNESLFEQNVHRAVAASPEFDPCTPSNLISWDPYEGWDGDISAYEIYGRAEGGSFDLLGFVSPDTRMFAHEGITVGNQYQYYIKAVHINGTSSLSAIGTVSSLYPDPPDFITIDYVSVLNASEVEIAFTADMTGEVNDFRIMKRSNPGTPYVEVTTIQDAGGSTQLVIDEFPTSGNSYEYLVQSLYLPPSCSEPIILSQSNTGTNILLEYEVTDQTISLNWTPYEEYPSGLSGYTVQRSNVNGEFLDIFTVGPGTTSWQETVESVIDGYQTGELQYRIAARESLAGNGESFSNTVAVHVVTHLQVPNAFTPGSNDMNYEFKPLLDFAPSDYLMIILDRGGRKLFETRDPGQGWDGRFQQGDFVAEGVYVYYIQYTDYTGLFKNITGNVTVLYP
jgi:hypothetical protein